MKKKEKGEDRFWMYSSLFRHNDLIFLPTHKIIIFRFSEYAVSRTSIRENGQDEETEGKVNLWENKQLFSQVNVLN